MNTPKINSLQYEIADLLATGYLRFRRRQARQAAQTFFEKTLDDVTQRGMIRTTENRTPEKGAAPHDG